MRALKLCVAVGLVLAVATPGLATPINWLRNPLGRVIEFKYENWDMATVYDGAPVGPHIGPSAVNAVEVATGNGMQIITKGSVKGAFDYTDLREDGWGVFRIKEIEDRTSNEALWDKDLDNVTEIVGIFYGLVDTAVQIDPQSGKQFIDSDGMFFEAYAQPKGTFEHMLASMGRVAFGTYATIGTTWTDLNNDDIVQVGEVAANPLATLIISAEGTPGVTPGVPIVGPPIAHAVSQQGDFTTDPVLGPPFGAGGSFFFVDGIGGSFFDKAGGGTEDGYWEIMDNPPSSPNPNFWPTLGLNVSQEGDLYLEADTTPYYPVAIDLDGDGTPGEPGLTRPDGTRIGDYGDWTVFSDDPGLGHTVIPEPMTVLGVVAGLAALGGYLRKRRNA